MIISEVVCVQMCIALLEFDVYCITWMKEIVVW